MADFCRQCSIDHFGRDFRELADFTSIEENEKGIFANVLCEGCGFIQVDAEGNCVTKGCVGNHSGSLMDYE